jgi:D-tagatose-1,6-bisphosphate aldolase subunit GatZ/KbaZ
VDLQYSLSDRIRYYWPAAQIEQARGQLFDNLRSSPPPLPLLSQYLPQAYAALRAGQCHNTPEALVMAHLYAVLDDYHHACTPNV